MTQETKQNQRLVSKIAYVGILVMRVSLRVGANLLMFAGMMFIAYILCVLVFVFLAITQPLPSLRPASVYGGGVAASLLLAGGSYLFFKGSASFFERIEAMNNVLPLTRANTTHFPAPESLVRASQQPAQAQQDVLLRAAAGEVQSGDEQQLLRASVDE